jgi:hypothetical protein
VSGIRVSPRRSEEISVSVQGIAELEAVLSRIWTDVLGRPVVAIHQG